MRYRWLAEEKGFARPIRVGDAEHWQTIRPSTTEWQETPAAGLDKAAFQVPTDLYYINVNRS